ncbi:hypothetical protein [Anaerocolumna jejuensis]|uniref:hypothetical protein n=1 Tax=Anaerocolumna jejuensis TaxID=259063 RepID=UPI003F7C6662
MKKGLVKFISTLLVAVMLVGATPVFAAGDLAYDSDFKVNGDPNVANEVHWTLTKPKMRLYVQNKSKYTLSWSFTNGTNTYYGDDIAPGKSFTKEFSYGKGDYTLYLDLQDGNVGVVHVAARNLAQ